MLASRWRRYRLLAVATGAADTGALAARAAHLSGAGNVIGVIAGTGHLASQRAVLWTRGASQRRALVTRTDWVREDGVTISGGAWYPDLSAALLDVRPSVVTRAVSREPYATMFDIDLGALRRVGLFHCQMLLVSLGARVRLRAGLDSSFSTVAYDSGLVNAAPSQGGLPTANAWSPFTVSGDLTPREWSGLALPRYFVLGHDITCRYVRFEIFNSSASFAPGIGCFGACEVWEIPDRLDVGYSISMIDASGKESAVYGSDYFDQRSLRRRVDFVYRFLDYDDYRNRVLPVALGKGRSEPVVFVPEPNAGDDVEKTAVYGTVVDDVIVVNPHIDAYDFAMRIEQLI